MFEVQASLEGLRGLCGVCVCCAVVAAMPLTSMQNKLSVYQVCCHVVLIASGMHAPMLP